MLIHIILVLDDQRLQQSLKKLLASSDVYIETVKDHSKLTTKLAKRISDLVIISEGLIRGDKISALKKFKGIQDAASVVILTDEEDDDRQAQFIAAGCDAVLDVNLPLKKLVDAIKAIVGKKRRASRAMLYLPRKTGSADISDFAASSPAMKKFIRVLPRIAKSSSSVLILGETGVGKERLAHVLHRQSPRSESPFIAIHCGALPESLLESELFGHEQGAFTGATKARRGCFELAHQGTIFLDEIGEMPLHLQSKLLRVLEDKQIRRVGSERSISVDVRVMTATNRDLEEEVKAKQFRRDLYYRLNVVSLTLPPLRERIEDIPELVESHIAYLGPRIGRAVTSITDDALEALCGYSWPGNVRELINVIERAMLLCETDVITLDDLPVAIAEEVTPASFKFIQDPDELPDDLMYKSFKEARREIIEQFEYNYITNLLDRTNGKVGAAAEKADIDARTLFNKMKKFGLNKNHFKG